jgi:transposase-like protein
MSTRKFVLTESEALALNAAYLHMQTADTKIRFQAVRLYGLGYAVSEILDICGASHSSLSAWVRLYQHSGLTALLDHRKGGNHAKLGSVTGTRRLYRTGTVLDRWRFSPSGRTRAWSLLSESGLVLYSVG